MEIEHMTRGSMVEAQPSKLKVWGQLQNSKSFSSFFILTQVVISRESHPPFLLKTPFGYR
ncbi:Uncharacterized protein APZ42_025902 [Daphnia magna]|uniref:Uncharacterized protein n=1 Tax=Daphnia magna TaxID=35525 RepID=A0A164SN69_9CRUS|nr:Uncharacterized protein APZ42_025902 [Daphnia magna]